jgi:hypothetical protein
LCEQRGDPPELAHRVLDDLVLVHRGAAPERGVVRGLAEREPGFGRSPSARFRTWPR